MTSIVGNTTSIAAGVIVFDDPLGTGPMVAARVAAFVVVLVVAALLPGPIHAHSEKRQQARAATPQPT